MLLVSYPFVLRKERFKSSISAMTVVYYMRSDAAAIFLVFELDGRRNFLFTGKIRAGYIKFVY